MTTTNIITTLEDIAKAGMVAPTTLNGLPGMSSLEIAEITGKKHHNILRDIRKMLTELDVVDSSNLISPQFVEAQYLNSQGKAQPLTILNKELTFTLLARYSFKLANLIVKRWQALEGSGFERVSVQATVVHLVELEKDTRRAALKAMKRGHRNSVKGLKAAVRSGNLTPEGAHVLARRDGLRVTLAAFEQEAIG